MDITLERIIQELNVKEIKKTELTEHLGFSSSAIFGHWLSGRNSSYKKYIHAIADYLNVSVEYLKGETDQKEKPLTIGEELSEDEKMLLNLFRQIPEERQQAFLEMGRLYSDSLK